MNEHCICKYFDKKKFVREQIMLTSDALEFLEISRPRLNMLIKQGKIEPIIRTGATSVFLREDLIKKKEEMIALRLKYRPGLYQ
ncbi:TPA: DNA-binding protein [Bacillus paranthracis]|nr:DNA-binding protein [Bacillus paranthracis]